MNAAPQEKTPPALMWQLVRAAPGALVYSLPAVKPPRLGHRGGRGPRGKVPGGLPEEHTGAHPGRPERHLALDYAFDIGRIGLLAAPLGVGAAVARA